MSDIEEDVIENLFHNPNDSDEDAVDEKISLQFDTYKRNNEELKLSLVSRHHSLWGEFVYNAARLIADRIEKKEISCQGKKCLELGAGAGLPSIIAALNGADQIVISDYGSDFEMALIYAIDINIQNLLSDVASSDKFYGVDYIWGNSIDRLIYPSTCYQKILTKELNTSSFEEYKKSKLENKIYDVKINNDSIPVEDKFDIMFVSDLIFNRSEHYKLLWTIKNCLKPKTGICHFTFSHHDPTKTDQDLNFFEIAKKEEFGMKVTHIANEIRPVYPFKSNDGLDDQRSVVYYYTIEIL